MIHDTAHEQGNQQDDEMDPIVAEVRRVREEIAREFDYDLSAICADAQRRTEEAARAGRKVVSLPPRRPAGWTESARAGKGSRKRSEPLG